MQHYTESKVEKEEIVKAINVQLENTSGFPFLHNATPSDGPTNGSSCQTNLNSLVSQFFSCGYLSFNQKKNGIVKSDHFDHGTVLKCRFDFPDKHLGDTLQGYTARCFDRKDRQYRCVKVALKSLVVTKKSLKNVPVSENFLRERQLLQKLSTMKDCPSAICKYVTHWECSSFYYVATEYCPGGNLFYYSINVLHANAAFQPDGNQQECMRAYPYMYCPKERMYMRLRVIQKIFAQLVSAVEWLHSKNICHLDLSLENILIQNENVFDPQIQIIDFGVGVDFGELNDGNRKEGEKERTKRPRWNLNVGKSGYKAFEVRMSDDNRRKSRLTEISSRRALAIKQIHDDQTSANREGLLTEIAICDLLINYVIDKTYDPFKADIWSMGVILFLLLFCRYPFHHADLDDSLFQIILQDKLLFWLMEQKALCWITAEIFDVLNQIFKPEFLRIDTDRLFVHPFCKLADNMPKDRSIHAIVANDIAITNETTNHAIHNANKVPDRNLFNFFETSKKVLS